MDATGRRAQAHLDTIRAAGIECQHAIDWSKVAAIVAHVQDNGGSWDLPPILVVEDMTPIVLDGHHRAAAAVELGLEEIPAWIVPVSEYAALVEDVYDGYAPTRIADLDEQIDCGGSTYAELGLRSK